VVAEAAFPGLAFECREHRAGTLCYRETGTDLPPETLDACRAADAILFGSVGLPEVRFPDGTELAPRLIFRVTLDLYAGVRPIKRYAGVPPTLAGDPPIDYLILRENTEGLYASQVAGVQVGDRVASGTMVVTRGGTERIVQYVFRLARGRGGAAGDGKRRVRCVDKANVLTRMAFFRRVFDGVAREFQAIAAAHVYLDTMALHMVRQPLGFDVVVAENTFGESFQTWGRVRWAAWGWPPPPMWATPMAWSSHLTAPRRTSPARGSPNPSPRSSRPG
jgi:3-isopropylmalate dehydrogenase